jgi:3-hydroxyisobutyrate dehydrogenase-like beta-hydroxyacid dehydrogenase
VGEKPDRRWAYGAVLEPDSKGFSQLHASILEAVNKAEVIFIIVYDPPAVQSVLNQIQSKLGPGQLVIQSSTISAKWTRLFAEEVRKRARGFWRPRLRGAKSRRNSARLFIIWAATPK